MKKKVTRMFEYMCSSCGMTIDMCMPMSGSCCDLIMLSPWRSYGFGNSVMAPE